ncbi:hypothetical protein FRB97_006621 [Tulasnella sp. 331]|nr:hypothetical protein FRB97_006621 [Tulasnella sp. 331]
MPPKRKRTAEEPADATTATKKRATKAAPAATTRKTRGDMSNSTPVSVPPAASSKASAPAKPPKTAPPPKAAAAQPVPVKEPEYTLTRLNETFAHYADPNNQKMMSTEGLQRLFEDAEISMEGVVPLLLAWTCKSEEFGVITLDEWSNLRDLRVDTPRKLQIAMDDLSRSLYSSSTHIPAPLAAVKKKKGKKPEPEPEPEPLTEQGIDVERKAAAARQKFKEFYMFCFTLMKNSEARVLDMETATVTWSVVLQEKFTIVARLQEFIQAHPSYKAVNKDLWTMTLEFCYAAENKDLMNWNDDESWPSMLDEFVAWEKSRRPEDVEMAS